MSSLQGQASQETSPKQSTTQREDYTLPRQESHRCLSSLSTQQTERFGPVTVEKDEHGVTTAVFGEHGEQLDRTSVEDVVTVSFTNEDHAESFSRRSSLEDDAIANNSETFQTPPKTSASSSHVVVVVDEHEQEHEEHEEPEEKEEEKKEVIPPVVVGEFPILPRRSFQNTQRFGDVVVERDEQGKTIRMYPSERHDVEKETPPSSPPLLPLLVRKPSASPRLEDPKLEAFENDDELFEFGNPNKMTFCVRMRYAIERDCFNWYGSILSLLRQGWGFESFMCLFFGVGSTCFFCYYRTAEGLALAARLDFAIIGSAVVFPVTFLIAETFRRREGAIQRLATIKALVCQIELAMLNWRWKDAPVVSNEWEDKVHSTLHTVINSMAQVSMCDCCIVIPHAKQCRF